MVADTQTNNRRVIAIALIIISAIMLAMSYSQVLTSDDLLYGYRLDTAVDDPMEYMYGMDHTALPITSVADVVRSQAFHYCHWHGRTLVTAMEQFFSGVSTPEVYYPVNVCMVMVMMALFVRFTVGRAKQFSLWAWAVTIVFFLYGTPGDADILTSINLSANYVWPTVMALCALLLWRHYLSVGMQGHAWLAIALIVVGTICGWSHEGICLPLSGMWLIYYIRNRPQWRTCGFAAVVGYWLGSLILLAAPGNLLRGGSRMDGNFYGVVMQRIVEAMRSLLYSNTLWIIVLIVICLLVFRRKFLVRFAKRNWYLIVAACMALMIAVVFFMERRTYYFFDVIGAILLIRMAFDALAGSRIASNRWLPISVIGVATVVYGFIAYYQIITYRNTQSLIDSYLAAPDGLAEMPDPAYPEWLKPFMARPRYGFEKDVTTFIGKGKHPKIVIVSDEEMRALEQGTLMNDTNRIGNSDFFTVATGYNFWTTDSAFLSGRDYSYLVAPASLDDDVQGYRKLARLLHFHNYTEQYPILLGFEEVHTRFGTFVITPAYRERRVIDIKSK